MRTVYGNTDLRPINKLAQRVAGIPDKESLEEKNKKTSSKKKVNNSGKINRKEIPKVSQKLQQINKKPKFALKVGQKIDAKVVKICEKGVILQFESGQRIFMHLSEMSVDKEVQASQITTLDEVITVTVIATDDKFKKFTVSMINEKHISVINTKNKRNSFEKGQFKARSKRKDKA